MVTPKNDVSTFLRLFNKKLVPCTTSLRACYRYWLNYWHILISKGTSSFKSNTLLIKIQKKLWFSIAGCIYFKLQICKVHKRNSKYGEMGENTPFSRKYRKRSLNYLGTLGNPKEGKDKTNELI